MDEKASNTILNEIGSRWLPRKVHPLHKRKIPKTLNDFMQLPFERLFTVTGKNLLKPKQLSMFIKNLLWILPRDNDVIWTTNPRSGYNWTLLILHYLISYEFDDVYFKLELDEKSIKYNRSIYGSTILRTDWNELNIPFRFDLPIPRLIHTHGYHKRSYNSIKILLQIRNPIDCILSTYYHPSNKFYPSKSIMTFLLESPKPLQTIEFLNSWGRAIEIFNLNCLIVRYERLKENTFEVFQEIVDFIKLPVNNDENIKKAIEQCNINRIRKLELKAKKKIDVNTNFYARKGGSNYIHDIDKNSKELIKEMISKKLKYDFGYNI